MDAARTAVIQYSNAGPIPMIEVSVPHGTKLKEAVRLHEFLSKDLISKLSPRGCTSCTSGVHILIREEFEDVVRVDLASLKTI